MPRTSLTTRTAVTLAGNLAKGVPLDLSEEDARYWNAHLGELHAAVASVIRRDSVINPYTDDHYAQTNRYPEGWEKDVLPTLTLEAQAQAIQPIVGFDLAWDDEAQTKQWENADCVGLWPTLDVMAEAWNIKDPYDKDYPVVVATLCDRVNQHPTSSLHNCLSDYMGERFFQLVPEVKKMLIPMEREARRQGHSCLALPVNLGEAKQNGRKTGQCYSPRYTLWECLHAAPQLLPLEPAGGICVVIATRVMTAYEHQWKWFPGARFRWEAGGSWSYALCFYFDGDRLKLYASFAGFAHGHSGAVVASPGV